MYCYVRDCPNSCNNLKKKKNSDGINYFSVPQDKALFEKWRRVIPTSDKVFSQNEKLCELHFLSSEVLWFTETKLPNGNVRRLLRDEPILRSGTIPSIFPQEKLDIAKTTGKSIPVPVKDKKETLKISVKTPTVLVNERCAPFLSAKEKFATPKSVKNSKTPVPIKKEKIETPVIRLKEPMTVEKRNPKRVKRRSTILEDYVTDDELNRVHGDRSTAASSSVKKRKAELPELAKMKEIVVDNYTSDDEMHLVHNSGVRSYVSCKKRRRAESPEMQPIIRLVPLECLIDKKISKNKAEGGRLPSTEEIDLELKKIIEIPLLTSLKQKSVMLSGGRPSMEEINCELKKVIDIPLLTSLRQKKFYTFKGKQSVPFKPPKKTVSKAKMKTVAKSSSSSQLLTLMQGASASDEANVPALGEVKTEQPDIIEMDEAYKDDWLGDNLIEEELARMEMDTDTEDVKSSDLVYAQGDDDSITIKSEDVSEGEDIQDVLIKSEDGECEDPSSSVTTGPVVESVVSEIDLIVNHEANKTKEPEVVAGTAKQGEGLAENRSDGDNIVETNKNAVNTAEESQDLMVSNKEQAQEEEGESRTETKQIGEESPSQSNGKVSLASTEGQTEEMEVTSALLELQPLSQGKESIEESSNEVEPKSDQSCQKEMAGQPVTSDNSQQSEIHSNADIKSSDTETTSVPKITEICDSEAVEGTQLGDETQITESTDNAHQSETVDKIGDASLTTYQSETDDKINETSPTGDQSDTNNKIYGTSQTVNQSITDDKIDETSPTINPSITDDKIDETSPTINPSITDDKIDETSPTTNQSIIDDKIDEMSPTDYQSKTDDKIDETLTANQSGTNDKFDETSPTANQSITDDKIDETSPTVNQPRTDDNIDETSLTANKCETDNITLTADYSEAGDSAATSVEQSSRSQQMECKSNNKRNDIGEASQVFQEKLTKSGEDNLGIIETETSQEQLPKNADDVAMETVNNVSVPQEQLLNNADDNVVAMETETVGQESEVDLTQSNEGEVNKEGSESSNIINIADEPDVVDLDDEPDIVNIDDESNDVDIVDEPDDDDDVNREDDSSEGVKEIEAANKETETSKKVNKAQGEHEDDIDIEAEVARLESEVGPSSVEATKEPVINISNSEDEENEPPKKSGKKETNQCQEIAIPGTQLDEISAPGVQNLFTPETIQEILKQIKLPLTTPVTLRIAPLLMNSGSSSPGKDKSLGKTMKATKRRGRTTNRLLLPKPSSSKEIRYDSIEQFKSLTKTRTVFDIPTFISDIDDETQFWKLWQVIRESFHELIEARNTKTSIGKLTLSFAINKSKPQEVECSTVDSEVETSYEVNS